MNSNYVLAAIALLLLLIYFELGKISNWLKKISDDIESIRDDVDRSSPDDLDE